MLFLSSSSLYIYVCVCVSVVYQPSTFTKACSQTTNTGTLASSLDAYMYICLYTYIMPCYTYILYVYIKRMYKHIGIVHSAILQKRLAYTYIFENELFPTSVFQQRQHLDAAGCQMFLVG